MDAGLSRRRGRDRRARVAAAQPAAAGAGSRRQEPARRPPAERATDPAAGRHRPRPPAGVTQTEICDGNEIAAFVTALETLPQLRGCLITADALHTQRGHAAYLLGRGAHYLFTVKDNQPTLHRALAALPWRAAPRDTDPGSPRRHGRLESRTATVLDLAGTGVEELFPGAARAMKIVRRRIDTAIGVTSTETVYAITSLGHRYADAVLLAIWLRGHWQIENTLHWVRDVTFGEDHSAVRAGAGPQIMAALRNTAINVSRLAGHANIAAAQRHYSWTPGAAIDAITAA